LGVDNHRVSFIRLDKANIIDAYWNELARLFKSKRSAFVLVDNDVVGIVGELSAIVLQGRGLPTSLEALAFELDLSTLLLKVQGHKLGISLKNPPIVQDLCFMVNKDVEYANLIGAVSKSIIKIKEEYGENIVLNVSPLDIYLDQDKKNITLRIVFASLNRTLTEKDLTKARDIIIKTVQKEVKGQLKD